MYIYLTCRLSFNCTSMEQDLRHLSLTQIGFTWISSSLTSISKSVAVLYSKTSKNNRKAMRNKQQRSQSASFVVHCHFKITNIYFFKRELTQKYLNSTRKRACFVHHKKQLMSIRITYLVFFLVWNHQLQSTWTNWKWPKRFGWNLFHTLFNDINCL